MKYSSTLLSCALIAGLVSCSMMPSISFGGADETANSAPIGPTPGPLRQYPAAEDVVRQDPWHQPAREPFEAKLYARDGSPVPASPQGVVTIDQTRTHDVQPDDGSRLYLLELYQQAVDDKDEYLVEVEGLTAALETSEMNGRSLEERITQVMAMNASLQKDKEDLFGQNMDLAGRLTTAQIRRLESEKLLLKATIEWNRLKELTGNGVEDNRATAEFVERREGTRE